MAVSQTELKEYGMFGAVAGVATSFVLGTISKFVSMIPGVSLNLQSISISGQVSGALNTGLSTYVQKALGMISVPLQMSDWIWSAVGGALFVIIGLYVADMLGVYKGSRLKRIATVFVVGGLVSGFLIAKAISIPSIPLIITMAVDALVLAWIGVSLDKSAVIVPR